MPLEWQAAAILSGLFGLLWGSFLNVCIYRLPRDLSVVAPRSFCPECGASIAWFDNIPVASFLFLRGRSRCCGRTIVKRYLLVEVITAVLFAAIEAFHGLTVTTFKWMVFASLLTVLFWTDLEERLLPDELTLGGTLAGLLFAFWVPVPDGLMGVLLNGLPGPWRSLINAAVSAAILAGGMWALATFYSMLRSRTGLGLGDVKLLLLLGAFSGLEAGLQSILIGSVAGSLVGVFYILVTRQDAATYWLPFGSFLCAGAALSPVLTHLRTLW